MAEPLTEPHDLQAERAVLGAILFEPHRLAEIEDLLMPADFYRAAHQTIYRHLQGLAEAGTAIDLLPLTASLERAKQLEAVNGQGYLTALVDGMPKASNAGAYAGIVKELAVRRQVMKASLRLANAAADADLGATELLEIGQKELWAIALKQQVGSLTEAPDLAKGLYKQLEDLAQHKNGLVGLSTGLAEVDALLLGLRATDLIILAARPAMGKSSLVVQLGAECAKAGQHALIFSLEMSKEQLMFRLAATEAHVDLQRLMSGRTKDTEYTRISQALERISEWPLSVDDAGMRTVADIRATARRLQARSGLGLVLIDYLQLLSSTQKIDNRVVELGQMSRALKMLAKELHVPVIAVSQLSRKVEDRRPPRPMLSDLRESGALEQDADVVLLLWREEEYQATPQNTGLAELIVAKQRNGPTGAATLKWWKEETRFANLQRT